MGIAEIGCRQLLIVAQVRGRSFEDGAPELRVVKRLDAELIPRAEQTASRSVPDGEREVAEQAPDATYATLVDFFRS